MSLKPDTPSSRVLVVDDEPNIVDVITMALRFHEFEVETAADGNEALEKVAQFRPDLIVLDVMMPGLDGFEVAKRLGERRTGTPILFLTARDTTDDKVRGLTIGGDDYMTKPFSIEELLARIKVILKRTAVEGGDEGPLRFLDLELDDETREVFRDSHPVDLTDTEFRLLRYLMNNPRRALTRSQILDHVWDYDFSGDARVLETYVSYLQEEARRVRPQPDLHGARRRIRPAGTAGLNRVAPAAAADRRPCPVGGGLLALDVISYRVLENHLGDRTDEQVESASRPLERPAEREAKGDRDLSPVTSRVPRRSRRPTRRRPAPGPAGRSCRRAPSASCERPTARSSPASASTTATTMRAVPDLSGDIPIVGLRRAAPPCHGRREERRRTVPGCGGQRDPDGLVTDRGGAPERRSRRRSTSFA